MLKKYINAITAIDCMIALRELPDNCVDLVIADPPYNLDKDFGPWKEWEHRDHWLPWCQSWIDECVRTMKDGGNIFIHGIHEHLCWIQCYLHEIGLSYRRQIIWNYENGFSRYKNNLSAHYEPILWFSKGPNYTYHPIREPYKSGERLRHRVTKNGKIWHPHPEGRLAGDVWKIPTLAGRRFREEKLPHPTQKPLTLSRRIVEHFSSTGDVVLVPFSGSGTECVAAALTNRHYIGFDLNPEYAATSSWESTASTFSSAIGCSYAITLRIFTSFGTS